MAAAVGVGTPRGGYRPALDGLRAISVIAIMLFHAEVPFVHGGYWAVNVFFIVSGYLITGLLLKERDRWGQVDLVAFYVRRAKRLFPALLLVVLAVSVATPLVMGERAPATTRGDGLASLFYVANWRFIISGQSYFEQFGDPSPFRHMWTLAIEEQYYLVFPVLLLTLLAVLRRRWRVTAAVAGLVALSALAMYLMRPEAGADASRVYYGTDTRMQDVLTGSVLALALWALRERGRARLARHRQLLTAMGVVGVGGMVAALLLMETAPWVFPAGYLLFNTGFAVLVVLVVEVLPDGPIARVMAWAPLAKVGELSYSLYLWHWPVFVMLDDQRTGLSGAALLAARLAVTVPLAVASYALVENPVRRGRVSRWLTPSRTGVTALASFAVVGLVASLALGSVRGTPVVQAGEAKRVAGTGSGGDPLLIVGDSVGFSLGYNFPREDFPEVDPTAQVRFGCGTAVQHLAVDGRPQNSGEQECTGIFPEWTQAVRDTRPSAIVWSLGGWEVFDHVVDGQIVSPGSDGYRAHLTERLTEGLAALPGDAPVIIPNVPCYQQKEFVVDGDDLSSDRNDAARSRAVNEVLTDFAKGQERVHLADTYDWLCPGGTYRDRIDGLQTRDDGVHYSADGARQFWRWLMPQIRSMERTTT